MNEKQREEIAQILETIAAEGLPHPRHLDAALDAIADIMTPELDPGRQERLIMLAEEASEVIQEVCKYLRHGRESHNPLDPQAVPNHGRLKREMQDLHAVASQCGLMRDFDYQDHAYSDVANMIWKKKRRYTHHQG